jgi:hypothetical protein
VAQRTVTIGLNGTWSELDLTDAAYKEVMAAMTPWMAAGHAPDSQPVQPPARRGRPPGRSIPRKSLEWGKAIRAFAEKEGIPYMTDSGKFYYSVRLRRAYDEYLRQQASGNGAAPEARGEYAEIPQETVREGT